MGERIDDGTGKGFQAQVNAENRLVSSSVTSTERVHSIDKGLGYNINTGNITISNALETTLLYVKNTNTFPLFFPLFVYNLGASTSGTGDIQIDIVKNPTTGDIITNANDVDMLINQDFGSAKTFTGLAYKGASTETLVNGTDAVSTRAAAITGRIPIALGAIILRKGNSIAINYTPPASNTNQVVQIAAPCFFQNIIV